MADDMDFAPHRLALEGPPPDQQNMQEDEQQQQEAEQASSTTAPKEERSQAGRPGWKRRFTRLQDWPVEWREQYEAFKAQTESEGRRELWESWEPSLRDQVWAATTTAGRQEMRQWQKAAQTTVEEYAQAKPGPTLAGRRKSTGIRGTPPYEEPLPKSTLSKPEPNEQQLPALPSQAAQPLPSSNSPETESHDWMEGARIGEASNLGPTNDTSPKPAQQALNDAAPNPPPRPTQENREQRGRSGPPTFPAPQGRLREPNHPRPRGGSQCPWGQERRKPGPAATARRAPQARGPYQRPHQNVTTPTTEKRVQGRPRGHPAPDTQQPLQAAPATGRGGDRNMTVLATAA